MAPILDEIAMTFAENVKIAKVDVDVQVELAQEYSISSLPTFILFENGDKNMSILGANKNALIRAIEDYNSRK